MVAKIVENETDLPVSESTVVEALDQKEFEEILPRIFSRSPSSRRFLLDQSDGCEEGDITRR